MNSFLFFNPYVYHLTIKEDRGEGEQIDIYIVASCPLNKLHYKAAVCWSEITITAEHLASRNFRYNQSLQFRYNSMMCTRVFKYIPILLSKNKTSRLVS